MPNVGEVIKAEREKKGLSIKDIEKGTSIRSLYLKAIEDGNYSIVPGEVYLKGFIRNYANYLGLDGQEMVNMYRESQNTAVTPPVVEEEINPQAERKSRNSSLPRASSKKWIAAVAALVIVSGIYFWQASDKPAPNQDKPAPETTAVQPTPQAPVQSAQQSVAQNKPVTLIAKYTDSCWTSVKADGKQIFEGTPKAGDSLTWDAQQNIEITLGNAGAVDLTHNGKVIGKIGAKGAVVAKTFTKQ